MGVKILISNELYKELLDLKEFCDRARYCVVARDESGKIIDADFTYLKTSANQQYKVFLNFKKHKNVEIIHIHNKRS